MRIFSTIVALLSFTTAYSQTIQETDSTYRQFDLNEVVVTGTRTPRFLKDTPIQTRVISARDIAAHDATNVQDLLQAELPGVEFSYAMNQQTHLNFSGFSGQSMLFLVDGERLAGETMDDIDFSRLTTENIERIEIVKGAASALYGSSASGGVVNIITKKSTKPLSVSVNGRLGKHNSQRYGGTIGAKGTHWDNTLSIAYNSIDNYSVNSANDPVTRVITDIYGEKTYNVKEQVTWTPRKDFSLTGRAGYFFRETARQVDIPERYRDFSGGLKMKWDISPDDILQASYAFDQYDKSDYYTTKGLDIRDYSNVQNTLRLLFYHSSEEGHTCTMGAEMTHDYLYNTKLLEKTKSQDCFDVFVQYDWQITDRLEMVAALRYDYFSENKDSHVTPKVNFCYKPLQGLAIRGGYGMGFRSPTLKERYYNFDMSGIWIVEGNESLKSETSHNFNLSAEYTKNIFNLTASIYYNKVKDKISTSAPYFKSMADKIPYLPYSNLEDYSVYGGEIALQARWNNGFSAKFTYAYTKEQTPEDNGGNKINTQYIPSRPHSLNFRSEYEKRLSKDYAFNISLNGRFLSSTENVEYKNYYNISEGTITVSYPAYTLWKLSFVQRFGEHIKLTAAIDNMFNYKPKYYYLNSPLTDGANVMIGLGVDF